MFKKILLFILLFSSINVDTVMARGGGGGSASGSGGGSGEGSVGSLIVFVIVLAVLAYLRKQKIKKAKGVILTAGRQDVAWDEASMKSRAREIFFAFQKDWSDYNVESIEKYTVFEFYKKIVLELSVLKNQGRQNFVNDLKIGSFEIMEAVDETDNKQDNFTIEIVSFANDVLVDNFEKRKLYVDSGEFKEYWNFLRVDNDWRLNTIKQATENAALVDGSIKAFAQKNGFYFDPDFGWLMMPNKGAVFNEGQFKVSDINNHVIGYFRSKIVEFYSFAPKPNSKSYIVAQAILPKRYNDILIKKKGLLNIFNPKGLRKIETESNDFNRKFNLWADPNDQVNSFELLTPNFMEKIYDLPFDLNIEVVGHFLYLYTDKKKLVDYDKMLEILSWAFDEMKM